jgi:squalene-hopene/tetraprenyl-beta-curcumene cyclase
MTSMIAFPACLVFWTPLGLAQAPTASTAPLAPQAVQAPAALKASDLEREVRGGMRWLRSAQDPSDGHYGSGVEDTSLVLLCAARCSDAYGVHDGPFVRRAAEYLLARQAQDGSIADAGADPPAKSRQACLAAQALAALRHAPFDPAIARAAQFLGLADASSLPALDVPGATERTAARAAQILAARDGSGSWNGARGPLRESAWALLELAAIQAELAAARGAAEAAPVEDLPEFTPATREAASAALERGALFLAERADGQGRFGAPGKPDAGLTAMCLAALQCLPAPRPAEVQRKIDAGLAWLATQQKSDGSIHDGKLANYVTSASIMAFARAARPEYLPLLADARRFLQRLQADEGEGYSEGDLYYGGIGYGSTERPDLSNLQMALEALASAGLERSDPTYAKALRYLQRCQNRSESNDLRIQVGGVVVAPGDDGGAGYAPGDSKAGFTESTDGQKRPRSYGSMTYALLKCYAFAGLAHEDPRVAAAWEWCQKHYTLDVNPGFEASSEPSASYQGLFYYLTTMARALEVFGVEVVTTPDGVAHPWRSELCGRLVAMQSRLDGSWINHNSQRWNEGNPLLATAYALLALDAAMPKAAR